MYSGTVKASDFESSQFAPGKYLFDLLHGKCGSYCWDGSEWRFLGGWTRAVPTLEGFEFVIVPTNPSEVLT